MEHGHARGREIKLAAGALHSPAAVVDAGRSAGDGAPQPAITRSVRGGAEDPGVPRWQRRAAGSAADRSARGPSTAEAQAIAATQASASHVRWTAVRPPSVNVSR